MSDYTTRVTAILRAIRDNVPTADDADDSAELSKAEQRELYRRALTLAVEEMERGSISLAWIQCSLILLQQIQDMQRISGLVIRLEYMNFVQNIQMYQ